MEIDLVVVPYESGRRGVGVGAGPEQLLVGGLADRLGAGGHDVRLVPVLSPEAENGREISASFALAAQVARAVAASHSGGRLPLVLSGNCTVAALGSVAGLGQGTAVVWLDAHGDLNTPETSPSGFFDGMALSVLLGRCWRGMASRLPGFRPIAAENVALVGVRDLDPGEKEAVERERLPVLSGEGLQRDLHRFLEGVQARTSSAYVHVDLDVLDPSQGRANAYASPGGLSVEDVISTLRHVAEHVPLGAVAITAYDPAFDSGGRILEAGLRIAEQGLP